MKYQIEVEIPAGKYCYDFDNDINCQYVGDAHYGAGCCNLVIEGSSIIDWEENGKHERMVKHQCCPSLFVRTMENMEQMQKRHEKEIVELRACCNHEKHHRSRYMWAPGHSGNDVEVCDFCGLILFTYGEQQCVKK